MVRGSELDVAVRASIVSLRFGAGLGPALIAEKLNLDAGTVRTTCFRIKKAANSEDLLELLKHCRTKSRSGRPPAKNAAAIVAATVIPSAPIAVDDKDNNDQPNSPEHEALAGTASISPDPLAENFETTAWPERDLTATANTTHIQPHSLLAVHYNLLPPNITPTAALDPQLAAPQSSNPHQPQQWPPRKT